MISSSKLRRSVLAVAPLLFAVLAVAPAQAVVGFGTASVVGLTPYVAPGPVAPVQIPEAATATAAAVTSFTSFVLTPSGVLAAGDGNLGLGADSSSAPVFTSIPGTAGSQAVAATVNATLILRGDGTVAAFGSDTYGQDGHAPGNGQTNTPTTVEGLDHATAIAAGLNHSLALKADGTVWAWGQAAALGNAAVSADTGTPHQVALPAGSVVTAIAAGGGQSLALLQDGSVWAWGANGSGQVGDGTNTDVAEPVQVIPPPAVGGPRVTQITAGGLSSYALYDDGTFEAWGDGGSGELGLGNGASSVSVPTPPVPAVVAAHPSNYPPLSSLVASAQNAYGITRDGGRVYGWGLGGAGQLGFGNGTPSYDFAFPYDGTAGDPSQPPATEIPQRIGRLTGATWLASGPEGQSQIVTAVQNLVPLAGGSVSFFSHSVGTVSRPALALFRTLFDPTTVTSIRVLGADAADFQIVRFNHGEDDDADADSLPLTIPAGGTLGVYLRFYPSALGDRNAVIQVSGDGETTSIPLTGFGAALPGNTPGAKGDTGPAGPVSSAGADGAAGVAGKDGKNGKDGVVTFTTKKATKTVKRGRTATLSFTIKNATAGRLLATTATATLPKALAAKGGKAIAVPALAPGASRTLNVKITAGRRVAPGTYTVKLRVPYGTRAVTASAKVRVVRQEPPSRSHIPN